MGGRGSSSSTTSEQSKTKMYVRQTVDKAFFKNKYVELDGKQAITDGFSIYQLNNAGIKEKGDEQLKGFIKGSIQSIQSNMKEQKMNYNSLDNLIKNGNSIDYERLKVIQTPGENYGFDVKRLKMAKTILGKNVEYSYVKTGNYSSIVFRNKKGETGFLLPVRIRR